MRKSLLANALAKVTTGLLLVGLLLFLPAGKLSWTNGWLFMGILFVPMVIAGFVMLKKNPSLLESRLRAKEEQAEQRSVVAWSGLMFIGGFVAAGLSYRFDFLQFPKGFVIAGVVLFLLSYVLYAEVLRENAYLSRIIEVQEGQTVVDTGLYGIVRHPMYAATVLLFLSMPLVLGSLLSFVIFLIYPFLIAKRIRNEEDVLEEGLLGYREYKQKVRWKILPWIW